MVAMPHRSSSMPTWKALFPLSRCATLCGKISNAPSTSLFRSIKKASRSGEASMHVVFVVALSGLLPSPTQMAPNNRELNKYEANKGEVRVRRHAICAFLHGLMPCSPMVRVHDGHVNLNGNRLSSLTMTFTKIYRLWRPASRIASRASSLMISSPATMSGRFPVNTLTTNGPSSSMTNPTSFATVS